MRTLYLVRHAKSSWQDTSLADHERPLNKRGLRDAPVMGQRLADKKVGIDSIWSSPARRALETARILARALNYPQEKVVRRDRLYAGTIESFLLELRSCPDEVKGLLVVGHNPLISEFADLLIGPSSDTDIEMIPTCGIVAMEFTLSSWQQLREKDGRFLFFDYPKKSDVVI